MRRRHRLSAVLFLVAIPALGTGCGGSSPATPSPPAPPVVLDLGDMTGERALGNPNAPVTLIEYSSLTCPHCATFHATTLAEIKSSYIDAGRVRYIYRDFPLDNAAVAAGQLARCAGNTRYFDALERLYRTQASWANANYAANLKSALAPLGLSAAVMDACLASTDLQGIVLQNRQAGIEQGVRGTPTFFINGTPLVGALPFADFKTLLDQ